MEKVLDYIVHSQSPANSFVEQRTYFSCKPATTKVVELKALDVVNVNQTYIVSLVNEKKELLLSDLSAADLLGFEFGRVLLVTEEEQQAYAFVQEFRQKLGYITNLQRHLNYFR